APAFNLTSAIEGTTVPAGTTIATFTNANTGSAASSFTASITWGDGAFTAGVVAVNGGTITVSAPSGGHTYADECACAASVTVSGAASATASGTIKVGEGDALSAPVLKLTTA